jgi:hypothetical protein
MLFVRRLASQIVGRTLTACGAGRGLAPLTLVLALGACATSPGSALTVLPGPGKDQAAFQQDALVCQQHAVAHTGYNAPVPSAAAGSAAGAANTVPPGGAQPFDEAGYLQCMASRGDTVQAQPSAYAAGTDPYGYAWPYGYPYAYPGGYPTGFGYPYPFYDGGLYGGFGFGFGHGRFDHDRFAHGGFGHDRFAHGGFGHGGFGHGGFGHGGGHR